VARLPYVDPATAAPVVRDTFEHLPTPLNIFRTLAHAETAFRPILRLGTAVLAQQELSGALRELAILRVARLSGAEYEWIQHIPIAEVVGVTRAQIDALAADDLDADCFDELERLVLAATTELVERADVSDATYEALAHHLSSREYVELLLAVGFYMLMARVMNATRIDPDPPAGAEILKGIR
jgi:alkylhydroperoxidase family enzyme